MKVSISNGKITTENNAITAISNVNISIVYSNGKSRAEKYSFTSSEIDDVNNASDQDGEIRKISEKYAALVLEKMEDEWGEDTTAPEKIEKQSIKSNNVVTRKKANKAQKKYDKLVIKLNNATEAVNNAQSSYNDRKTESDAGVDSYTPTSEEQALIDAGDLTIDQDYLDDKTSSALSILNSQKTAKTGAQTAVSDQLTVLNNLNTQVSNLIP